jgi:NAD+ kinase
MSVPSRVLAADTPDPACGSEFRSVALVGKYKSASVRAPLLELARCLAARGHGVMVDLLSAQDLRRNPYPARSIGQMARSADLGIVLGGDGTMLNIARAFAPRDVPLVGVNLGGLGFLTDVSPETMLTDIPAMLEGAYVVERRMMLECRVCRGPICGTQSIALNDIVVAKGAGGTLIELETLVDSQLMHRQRADGLIVATPTGSTAYGLSAGGPILHPALDAMAIVPVSPHTLSNRPVVIHGGHEVSISLVGRGAAVVYIDGRTHSRITSVDQVKIRRSPCSLSLLKPPGHHYFAMLRTKLGWASTPETTNIPEGSLGHSFRGA